MKKNELINALAKQTGQEKRAVSATIDALVGVLVEIGTNQDSVTLPGFGTFKGKTRLARTGRNPATGEQIEIPEKKILTFKTSSALNL